MASENDAFDLYRLYGYGRLNDSGMTVKSLADNLKSVKDCHHVLIASVNGKIVGCTTVNRFPEDKSIYPDWWIFDMLVRTPYRGAGIGEGLLQMALETAAKNGAVRMNLLVFEQNTAAINLYRKMGFRKTSIPGLDAQLEKEVRQEARRRIILSKALQ